MASPHPEVLTAKSGRVRRARGLARRNSRHLERLFLAEGIKALTEALEIPDCVVEVFATQEAAGDYADLSSGWTLVDQRAMESLAGAQAPQGIVAVCRFVDVSLPEVLVTSGPVVICADVRDPGNAGTIIRTADAAGATGVILAGHSVDPYNDKTVRATVGSLFHLPIAFGVEPRAAVAAAQAAGFVVLAADGAGELDLMHERTRALLGGKVAWLFGNEAWGLPLALQQAADHRVSIPIHGRAESLNLSTAAAVCLYAAVSPTTATN